MIAQDNRPSVFFSRLSAITQQKYSMAKIELLAIIGTLKEFKRMLWGQSIKVFTDHRNLARDACPMLLGSPCAKKEEEQINVVLFVNEN
jgi:hypothetical protein